MPETNFFVDMIKEFKDEIKSDDGDEGKLRFYPHNKRFMGVIDRMYEPPENCRNIPCSAVPQRHFNASKTCLMPGFEIREPWDEPLEENMMNRAIDVKLRKR